MDTHYFWAQNPNVAIRTLMRWRLSGCEYVHPLAERHLTRWLFRQILRSARAPCVAPHVI